MKPAPIVLYGLLLLITSAAAHEVEFKSPGASMHFTVGQPIIVFADLFDVNDGHGMIVCPPGQTVNPMNGVPGPATCSGGGAPTGWPQFQVLVDNVAQTDDVTHATTVRGTTNFDGNMNPDPINFNRFSVSGLAIGGHQVMIRGLFAPPPASNSETQDSAPISITVDALPTGRTTLSLNANVNGAINWTNLIVIGNGHSVAANGNVVISNTLVTGLGSYSSNGISGTATSLDIENSVFEATSALDLTVTGNVFAPEAGGGDLNQGIWFYGGETGIQIYNNTFDGGGPAVGDFAGPTVQVNNTSQVASLRNNLMTFSRNYENGSAGQPRVVGDAGTLASADYNAFYSPDNDNHDNYNITGMSEPAVGAHDVSGSGGGTIGALDGQLASVPFAGLRVDPYESVVDEGAVWQRTQKLSTILAAFRARYMPSVTSPIVNHGDPQDNDTHGRRTDIGAIDLSGHDADLFGKFGPMPDLIYSDGFQ